MRKTFALLLVLVFLTASSLLMFKPVSSDSTKPHGMRIIDFQARHPDCLVWNYVLWTFHITVENFGTTNVEGAILIVQMFDNGTELLKEQLSFENESIENFDVNAGEKREITGRTDSGMDAYFARFQGTLTYHVTLMLGDAVLDEYVSGYGSLARVLVVSPENKTYLTNEVSLIFTVDKPVNWTGYSLDGNEAVGITGNTTLSELETGVHNVTVIANDELGNTRTSETVTFTVAKPFPIVPVVAVSGVLAIIVGAVLIVIFKKRKR
jgi:hypothetical protein